MNLETISIWKRVFGWKSVCAEIEFDMDLLKSQARFNEEQLEHHKEQLEVHKAELDKAKAGNRTALKFIMQAHGLSLKLAILFLSITLPCMAQFPPPFIHNPLDTNTLGLAPGTTYFLGWNGTKPAWAVPPDLTGMFVAVNTNAVAVTNGSLVTISGVTDTNAVNGLINGASNSIVGHTVTVAGTANQITSSVGTAQTLVSNPSTTLSLPSPTIFPGQISVVGITNASGNSNSVAIYDAKTNLTYLSTGTGALTNNGSGVTGWFNGYADKTSVSNTFGIGTITFTIDGGGLPVATNKSFWVRVPWGGTILSTTLLTDIASSVGLDVWKTNYAQYPPLVANTIVASAPPAMTTSTKYQDATLTGWQKSFVTNDVFKFIIYSNSAATQITLNLDVIKQ